MENAYIHTFLHPSIHSQRNHPPTKTLFKIQFHSHSFFFLEEKDQRRSLRIIICNHYYYSHYQPSNPRREQSKPSKITTHSTSNRRLYNQTSSPISQNKESKKPLRPTHIPSPKLLCNHLLLLFTPLRCTRHPLSTLSNPGKEVKVRITTPPPPHIPTPSITHSIIHSLTHLITHSRTKSTTHLNLHHLSLYHDLPHKHQNHDTKHVGNTIRHFIL